MCVDLWYLKNKGKTHTHTHRKKEEIGSIALESRGNNQVVASWCVPGFVCILRFGTLVISIAFGLIIVICSLFRKQKFSVIVVSDGIHLGFITHF